MNSATEMKTEQLPLSTEVILFDVERNDRQTEVWSGSLADFLADNEEWLSDEPSERDRIIRTLATRKRVGIAGFVGCLYELRIASEVVR